MGRRRKPSSKVPFRRKGSGRGGEAVRARDTAPAPLPPADPADGSAGSAGSQFGWWSDGDERAGERGRGRSAGDGGPGDNRDRGDYGGLGDYRDPGRFAGYRDLGGGPEVMDSRRVAATGPSPAAVPVAEPAGIHRHRRSAGAGFGLADVGFSLGLLALAYAVTLAIWYVHRLVTDVAAGESTSRVVMTGALFGSASALSEAFARAGRGRVWAGLAGVAVAAAGTAALPRFTAAPDGSLLRDGLLPLAPFAVASVVCLIVLAASGGSGGSARRSPDDAPGRS